MSQSIPYSQQDNTKRYHQHQPVFNADGQYNHPHQYHHLNGYYGNQRYRCKASYGQRQYGQFVSHPTASWAPDAGKRKFEESVSESPTNTQQKTDNKEECTCEDEQNPTATNWGRPLSLHRSYGIDPHPPRSIGYSRYNSPGRGHYSYERRHPHTWQRSFPSQHYENENIPPARTDSDQRDLTCKGCLFGKDAIHLKFFHNVLTEAIYSSMSQSQDIMAQQIPGFSFVHDGLCFGFEKDPKNGDKWLVVRGTGCLGMAFSGSSKCQICSRQQSRVDGMMQEVMTIHAESPETMCQTVSIERLKMVPTLAEMKMRQLKCEIDDYKENSITVVNV